MSSHHAIVFEIWLFKREMPAGVECLAVLEVENVLYRLRSMLASNISYELNNIDCC